MGKGLRERDVKYQVHQKYYQVIPGVADLLLLENVPEYSMKEVVARELGSGWGCVAETIDPRLFGFATSRARTYALCWKKSTIKMDPQFPLGKVIAALKARPVMLAKNYFWQRLGPSPLTNSRVFWLRHVSLLNQEAQDFTEQAFTRSSIFPTCFQLRSTTCRSTRSWRRTGPFATSCNFRRTIAGAQIQWIVLWWLWPPTATVCTQRLWVDCGWKKLVK